METKQLILKGRVIVAGTVFGEALVAHDPVSFLGMVNTETGCFDAPGHELLGQCIRGRVLIYPHGKGSSGDAIRMWRLDKFKVKPAAILFQEAEPIHVQGAMLLDIPSLYGFDQEICAMVRSGDRVEIRNDEVTIRPVQSVQPSVS